MSRIKKEQARVERVKEYREAQEKPVVAILVPCYKQPHPRMQHHFAAMMDFTRQHGDGITAFPTGIVQSSVVHWVRNQLISDLIKSKRYYTHVMFVDDDIAVPPDTLVKLVSHNKDIVAGLCTKRQDPPIPNARLQDEATGDYKELWEWPDGLIEVGAVGTGLMLISREALQKVAEVYFQCLYEQDVWGMTPEKAKEVGARRVEVFDKEANAWWFRFLPPVSGVAELGEDIFFCHVARKYAGLQVCVDTTVQPEHMGDYGYSVADFLSHRDPILARAKIEGKYIAPPSLLAAPKSRIVVTD